MRRIPLLDRLDLVRFGCACFADMLTIATGLVAFELGALPPTVSGGVSIGDVLADSKLARVSSEVTVTVAESELDADFCRRTTGGAGVMSS
jgi:hypothetical protein